MTDSATPPKASPDFRAIAFLVWGDREGCLIHSATNTLRKLRTNPEALAKFLEGSGYVIELDAISVLQYHQAISNYFEGKRKIEDLEAQLAAANAALEASQKRVRELEEALSELRDFYKQMTGLPAARANKLLAERKGGEKV